MLEFTLSKSGPLPSLLKRQLNACHRDAMNTAGWFWHRHFRELHFSNAASRRYGYTPRQGEAGRPGDRGFGRSYTGRKLKKYGHTRPLEWSGESRRRTKSPRIVATAKRGEAKVRVIMNAPGLNRRYRGSDINMRDELTRVIPEEGRQIVEIAGKYLQHRYGQVSGSSTQKI